jgi:hypothetical protein
MLGWMLFVDGEKKAAGERVFKIRGTSHAAVFTCGGPVTTAGYEAAAELQDAGCSMLSPWQAGAIDGLDWSQRP